MSTVVKTQYKRNWKINNNLIKLLRGKKINTIEQFEKVSKLVSSLPQ